MKLKPHMGGGSVFDTISKDDLIIAFFPCIYFEALQMTTYQLTSINQRAMSYCEKIKDALERLQKRTYFHTLLYKLVYIVSEKGLRLIIENPATQPNYLVGMQNFPNPTFIDKNRMLRGDYFKKPTAYWYFNCEPTYGESWQKDKKQKKIMESKSAPRAGLCSEARSMISPDYARNFICDFVLGQEQSHGQLQLF